MLGCLLLIVALLAVGVCAGIAVRNARHPDRAPAVHVTRR